mgnify:CR=1 FL=1
MARHMEWSEERSPQWQYLLSRDRFAKRKKEVQEEPTARRRTKVEKRKYKKTLKNGRVVTVLWSSDPETPPEKNKEQTREEKDGTRS